MAKLVDALVSGTSVSNDVQVRVLFWAPPTSAELRAQSAGKNPEPSALSPEQKKRPGGEIGRHASLRGWCRLRCASSSLVLGTQIKNQIVQQSGFFCFMILLDTSNFFGIFVAVREIFNFFKKSVCKGSMNF